MYELMSLRVKCPECGHSLMDREHTVDNVPGIHLDVQCKDKKGEIWLSSIYGSFNFTSTIDLPKNEIVDFFCPECHKQVISKTGCNICGAYMVPFFLDIGGKVSICSRSGCKNHFVEFEDLSIALSRFYEEYGILSHSDGKQYVGVPANPDYEPRNENQEIIESGTFLHAYCPHCRKSLIEKDMLRLKVKRENESGDLILSPYLNVFSSKSTVFLPEDRVADDISCPYCAQSIIPDDKSCGKCGSPVAKINVSARTRLIDFYICTKKGCKWHGLSENDLYEIRLEGSMEW
jgi:predicted RNA-binding Zn-ribbon protein involved in translation (DUF1610 family)